jgi:hypothetical protein
MTTNLKEIQEFVKQKCGGVSLQHVLRALDKEIDVEMRISCGELVIKNKLMKYKRANWDLFHGPKMAANLNHQSKEAWIGLAKLLGYKEGTE